MKRDHEYTHFIAVLMTVAGLAAPRTMQAQSMSQPAGIMTQDDSVRMVSRYGKTVNGYRSDEKTYWLKTNGVALGMLITNVAFEAELLPRFTVSLPVYFSTLNYFSSKWKFRGFALQPELRYYPKLYVGRYLHPYVGAHFNLAYYNYATGGDYRYQDHDKARPLTGWGIQAGFKRPFRKDGRNTRWGIEAQLGIGTACMRTDKFVNQINGQRVDTYHDDYFGIDHISVSVYYELNKFHKTAGL